MAGNNNLAVQILINARDQATSVFKKVESTVDKTTQAIGQMAAAVGTYFALDNISGFFTSLVSEAAKLEQQFSVLQSATGATTEDLARLQAKAEELGASDTLSVSAVQAAQGMTELGRAGQSTEQILASITPVMALAQGAAMDLGTAAGIVTANLAGFQLSADQAGRVADVLSTAASSAKTTVKDLADALSYAAPSANAAGMSLEETTAIIAKMQNAGIDASRAGTALNSILGQLADPASTASKALNAAGISSRDFADVLGGLSTTSAKTEAAITAFGAEAGPALRALLAQGAESVKTLQAGLEGASGSAEKAAATMGDNLLGAIDAVSSVWDALKTSLGQPLLEPLTVQMRALSASLGEFASSSSFEAIKNGLVGTFNAASSAAAALGRNIGSIAVVAAGASFSALLSVVVKSTAAMAAYAASVAAARDAQLQQTLAERNASIAAAESAAANARVTASMAQRAAAANTLAQAELTAARATVASAQATVAASSGFARLTAVQNLTTALAAQTAAERQAAAAAITYANAQFTATQAAIAASAAANTGAASMTLWARAAAGLRGALTLLLSPLAMIGGLVSGIVGYKFGEWLRESAAEARGSASALGLLDSALRKFDDGLKSLSDAYRGQTEAEEALAEKRRQGAEILSLVERQTGLVFDSIQALGDAVGKGAVVFDRASETWRRGAVSMEEAASAATNLDAALQAQARAIADVAEREAAAEAIARTRREAAIELAKAYGDEAEALELTAQAREADAAQSQRLVELRAGELANAKERLAAMIAEAEASKEGIGAKQAEIGALTNLVEIKSKALVEAQMASEAAEQEANVARLATDTYGDQSAKVAELTEKRDALNAKLRESVAAQEAGVEAQKQLAEAEKVALGIAGEYIQAVQDGSPAVRDLAAAHAEAQAKVDALKAAIEAGKTAADGDKQAKEELRQTTAALADALDDLAKKREQEREAAESNTGTIEREGDLRVDHLKNLAKEKERRADLAKEMGNEAEARKLSKEAAELGVDALKQEVAVLGQVAAAKQLEVTMMQAELAAKQEQYALDGVISAAEQASLDRLAAQIQMKLLEIQSIQESSRSKQEEIDVTLKLLQLQDILAGSSGELSDKLQNLGSDVENLGEKTEATGGAATAMRLIFEGVVQDLAAVSQEAAVAVDAIVNSLGTWYDKIEDIRALSASDFVDDSGGLGSLRAELSELEATAKAASDQARNLQQAWSGAFNYFGEFYTGLGAIKELEADIANAEAAALRTEIAIEEMGDALDGITDSYDQGELSLAQYIAKLEQLRHQYSDLADEDLADVEDALADAKAEMQDFTDDAIDGLKDLQAEWAELNGDDLGAYQIKRQQERLELEEQIAQARSDNNTEALAALEQQLALFDQITAKTIEQIRLESKSVDASDAKTDALEDQAEAVEKTTEAIEDQTDAIEDQTDAVEEQADEVESVGDRLKDAYDNGEISLAQYIAKLKTALSSTRDLGDEDLSTLRSALKSAQAAMQSMTDSARAGVVSLRSEWASLNDDQKTVLDLEYQTSRLDLETEIAAAKAAGNKKALSALREQLGLLDKIHKKKLADLAEEQRKAAEDAAKEAADAAREAWEAQLDAQIDQLDRLAEAAEARADSATALLEAQSEVLQAELEAVTDQIEDTDKRIEQHTALVTDSLSDQIEAWGALRDIARDAYTERLEDIESTTEAALTALEQQATDERTYAERRAALYRTEAQQRLTAIRDYQREALALIESEYAVRRQQAEEAGDEVAEIDRTMLEAKRDTLAEIESAYRAHIDTLNEEANRHLDEVRSIEQQIVDLNASTEERLRSLRRQGMSDIRAYNDQRREIEELGAKARAAIQAGEFEEAQKYAQRMESLASGISGEVRDGDRIYVSKQRAARLAMKVVADAADLERLALEGLKQTHQDQADAAEDAAKQTEAALAEVKAQIDALQAQIEQEYNLSIAVDSAAIIEAQTELDRLAAQREEFLARTKDIEAQLDALEAERDRITRELQAELDRLKAEKQALEDTRDEGDAADSPDTRDVTQVQAAQDQIERVTEQLDAAKERLSAEQQELLDAQAAYEKARANAAEMNAKADSANFNLNEAAWRKAQRDALAASQNVDRKLTALRGAERQLANQEKLVADLESSLTKIQQDTAQLLADKTAETTAKLDQARADAEREKAEAEQARANYEAAKALYDELGTDAARNAYTKATTVLNKEEYEAQAAVDYVAMLEQSQTKLAEQIAQLGLAAENMMAAMTSAPIAKQVAITVNLPNGQTESLTVADGDEAVLERLLRAFESGQAVYQ